METDTRAEPRKRGAPRGNQNARKHGFYSNALKPDEVQDLQAAAFMEGLDEEIAILRLKLKAVIQRTPDNTDLQLRIIRTMARVLAIRFQLAPQEKRNLTGAIKEVLKTVGIPIGIEALLRRGGT